MTISPEPPLSLPYALSIVRNPVSHGYELRRRHIETGEEELLGKFSSYERAEVLFDAYAGAMIQGKDAPDWKLVRAARKHARRVRRWWP